MQGFEVQEANQGVMNPEQRSPSQDEWSFAKMLGHLDEHDRVRLMKRLVVPVPKETA